MRKYINTCQKKSRTVEKQGTDMSYCFSNLSVQNLTNEHENIMYL